MLPIELSVRVPAPSRAPPVGTGLNFQNSYSRLPERFYARLNPVPVSSPALLQVNERLAAALGLEIAGCGPELLAGIFGGNIIPEGAEPIATAYAGHQFGNFVPQLGDGRAILLGDVRSVDGRLFDIQLKGSGPTPFSRGGDGRAALGPALREYIVSEAMAALGVPTTRALAVVTTGQYVFREGPLPGGIVTRVAASHVRVGSFQYFAARRDTEAVKRLADFVIDRHYPALRDSAQPYAELLRAVIARQADLVARWMLVGFIHGVMNTDNMTISGETIDFGPCAFLDNYDPGKVFSSIDSMGRYAYGQQPIAGWWNLARFAETLLPLLAPEIDPAVALATEIIQGFMPRFEASWLAGMRRKLGLLAVDAGDRALIEALLAQMHRNEADFTVTFRRLAQAALDPLADEAVRAQFIDPTAYDAWAVNWRARLAREPGLEEARAETMRLANPAVIPRNHRVEQVLAAAVTGGDFAPFRRLVGMLEHPYDDNPEAEAYLGPPEAHERVAATFCGT